MGGTPPAAPPATRLRSSLLDATRRHTHTPLPHAVWRGAAASTNVVDGRTGVGEVWEPARNTRDAPRGARPQRSAPRSEGRAGRPRRARRPAKCQRAEGVGAAPRARLCPTAAALGHGGARGVPPLGGGGEGWGAVRFPLRGTRRGAWAARRDAGGVSSGDDRQGSAAPPPHRSAGCAGGAPRARRGHVHRAAPRAAGAGSRRDGPHRDCNATRPADAARRRGPQPPWGRGCGRPGGARIPPKKKQVGTHQGGCGGGTPCNGPRAAS